MRLVVIGALCMLAVGAAFADTVTIGGQSTYAYYPFRGC
jgi:hypothetical protein